MVEPAEPDATSAAGVRLGVVPSVQGVIVFLRAGGTRPEGSHRRPLPVVRKGSHDRIARPTGRTGDERIAKAPVTRRCQFLPARRAKCKIRADQQVGKGFRSAVDDFKSIVFASRYFPDLQGRDVCEPRRMFAQQRGEAVQFKGATTYLDVHAVRAVQHPAPELACPGELEDEGPKANALYLSLYMKVVVLHDAGCSMCQGQTKGKFGKKTIDFCRGVGEREKRGVFRLSEFFNRKPLCRHNWSWQRPLVWNEIQSPSRGYTPWPL